MLGQATAGVRAFGDAVDSVTTLIAEVDIEAAAQAVIDILSSLRETAEGLLGAVPLPEALRDEVAKFAEEVAAIDVETLVRQPLMAAVDQLRIPDDLAQTINDGLGQIEDVVRNLIPDTLAADLQAELDGLFSELEALDLSGVLGGIGDELAKVADLLETVDMVAALAPAQAAFDQARGVLERIRPGHALAPVIRAYDEALGSITLPDPQTIAERAGETVAAAGEPAARAATRPMRALAGEPDSTPPPASDPVTATDPLPEGVRPGELIRLVGFLPQKLKEALEAIEDGPAGEVMARIDQATGGLARDIRAVQAGLVGVEARIDDTLDAMIAELAAASVQAKVAVQGSAAVTAGPVDARASLDLLATLDAGRLRAALVQDLRFFQAQALRVRRSVSGPVIARTDQVAALLETCAVARFGTDLDALLAAIDPDPIADDLDEMFGRILAAFAAVRGDVEDDLVRYRDRVMSLIERFNPGAQAQKFLRALTVLKDLFDQINPRRLAAELDEVHRAILRVLDAFAPAAFAAEMQALIASTAAALRSLDPGGLTPDFAPVEAQAVRLGSILPLAAFEGIGAELDALGAELEDIDIGALLESVNTLTPRIVDAVELTAEGIQTEILALLGAIRYGSAHADVSVSASTGTGSASGGISL